MDDDIIRILVSTDNHLGYAERDPVRGNDCFAAFEEVLHTAKLKKADLILLAGDMFHENKPSRRTMHIAMELLRMYCLGDDPIFLEVLNDQKEIFKTTLGKVNYEDPYQSISLPVFGIHGNHDDPSREGGRGEALAALDLLAVSNLINYFGKVDRVEDIEITPLLIRKGTTNLAIYGLGAIRDERLNRMWNLKKVKFVRLTMEQGREDFFNIFVLHQNRDYGRGQKNCVHESMIPEWMDLVIWGNEHECQPQLMESLVGTYRILQPGSSIASSLSAGESSLCPKHMAFFEIKQKKFRMKPIRYTQVREFRYDDISLKHYPHLDPNHPKIEDDIRAVLQAKVNDMIVTGRAAVQDRIEEASHGKELIDPSSLKYQLIDPNKIIVRLRVEHEGFPAISHQRFGAQFIGEVANPADILLLAKKKHLHRTSTLQSVASTSTGPATHNKLQQLFADGVEDEIQKIKIEDLVNETLMNSKNSLRLLAETEMAQALDDYIVKKLPNAIIDVVNESLERTQSCLNKDKSADGKAAIIKATANVRSKTKEDMRREGLLKNKKSAAISATNDSVNEGNQSKQHDSDAGIYNSKQTKPSRRTVGNKAHSRRKNDVVDSSEEEDDMSIEAENQPPSTSRGQKSRTINMENEDDDNGAQKNRNNKSKKSAPSQIEKRSQRPLRRAAASAKPIIDLVDDDSEMNHEDSNSDEDDNFGNNSSDVAEEDDEEDYEELPSSKRKRGTTKPSTKTSTARGKKTTTNVNSRKSTNVGKERMPNRSPAVVDDIVDDDDGWTNASVPVSATPSLQSSVANNISFNTAPRRRQLPLSFSQSTSATQSVNSSSRNKTRVLPKGWDD